MSNTFVVCIVSNEKLILRRQLCADSGATHHPTEGIL